MYAVLLKTSIEGGYIAKGNLEVGNSYMTFETKEGAEAFKKVCVERASNYASLGKQFYEYCRDTEGEPDIDLYTAVKYAMRREYSMNLITVAFCVLGAGESFTENLFEVVEV